ncbi:hypothetical protein QRD86_00340 (plasmid) [Bacillus halotolerans]|uniref:hypothetical protein n=1 Tax=Bacillus halotolerans TaxID=260554 RepID=UPI002570686C|nr:hypothetical protein [Bacillus halotolerans]WJE41133.1 hypothetical protein QRD86_00340 [Bacillus halotolerans]
MNKDNWESIMESIPEDAEGIEIFQGAKWDELDDIKKTDQNDEIQLMQKEGLQDGTVLIPIINEDKMKAFLEDNIRIGDVPDYKLDIEKITYDEDRFLYSVQLKDGGHFTTMPEIRPSNNEYDYETYRIYFDKIPEYLMLHDKLESDDLHIRFDAKDLEVKGNFKYYQIVDRNFDKEPSAELEAKTTQNMANESFLDAKNHLKEQVENLDPSTISKEDIQELLTNHLENVEKILAGYNQKKAQGIPWKERFNSFKSDLKKSYTRFKESVRDKISEKIQALKDTPVNLKNKTKNKIIDGVVSVNNKIVDKTNNFTQKIEGKRPEKQSKSKIIDDYKTEYKKHLVNNFMGNEFQNEVNKILINSLDSQLTNKPHLSLRLRQEALNELNNEVLKGKAENLNVDIPRFKAYLEDKSGLLTHGLMHFEEFQQKELLTEDLKFNMYQEPEKKIEKNDNVSVKETNSEVEIKAKEMLEKYFNNLDLQEKEKYKFDSAKLDKETNKLTLIYDSIRDRGYTSKYLESDLKSGEAKEINKWVEDEKGHWVTKSNVTNTFNIYSQFNEKDNSNNLHAEKEEELER